MVTPVVVPSPLSIKEISKIEWGEIEITLHNGRIKRFKDMIIDGYGNAQEWDWKAYGTRHDPGIALGDVESLVESLGESEEGIPHLILTKGMEHKLKIHPDTARYIFENHNKFRTHVLETKEAVKLFNDLKAGNKKTKIVGLFHSTC